MTELDFRLPTDGDSRGTRGASGLRRSGGGVTTMVALLTLLVAVTLLVLELRRDGGDPARGQELAAAGLSEELALKLERRGLASLAADAHEKILASLPAATPRDIGNRLYRIGGLRQEAGEYERAVEAYYRAEVVGGDALAGEVRFEIGRRIQDCYERLGRFTALEEELTARTTLGSADEEIERRDEVVAEIGQRKITRRDLDAAFERQLDLQLMTAGASLSAEQRLALKEQVHKQSGQLEARQRLLEDLINRELLYRLARRLELQERPEMKDLVDMTVRQLLGGMALEEEVGRRLSLTDADVETYYQANRERYRRPARLSLSVIVSETMEDAERVQEELGRGGAFDEVAERFSIAEDVHESGPELPLLDQAQLRSRLGLPGPTFAALLATAENEAYPDIVETDKGFLVLRVVKKETEHVPGYASIQDQVRRELLARKQGETISAILSQLRAEEGVTVHGGRLQAEADGPEDGAGTDGPASQKKDESP